MNGVISNYSGDTVEELGAGYKTPFLSLLTKRCSVVNCVFSEIQRGGWGRLIASFASLKQIIKKSYFAM